MVRKRRLVWAQRDETPRRAQGKTQCRGAQLGAIQSRSESISTRRRLPEHVGGKCQQRSAARPQTAAAGSDSAKVWCWARGAKISASGVSVRTGASTSAPPQRQDRGVPSESSPPGRSSAGLFGSQRLQQLGRACSAPARSASARSAPASARQTYGQPSRTITARLVTALRNAIFHQF